MATARDHYCCHTVITHMMYRSRTTPAAARKMPELKTDMCQNFSLGRGRRQNRRYSVGVYTSKIYTNFTNLFVLLLNVMFLIVRLVVNICL